MRSWRVEGGGEELRVEGGGRGRGVGVEGGGEELRDECSVNRSEQSRRESGWGGGLM